MTKLGVQCKVLGCLQQTCVGWDVGKSTGEGIGMQAEGWQFSQARGTLLRTRAVFPGSWQEQEQNDTREEGNDG